MIAHAHETGTCYLVCFAKTPYGHAGHYLGWAGSKDGDLAAGLEARLADHAAGRGARLLAVAVAAGITWQLARTWPGTTEGHEKALKDLNNRRGLCPLCTPGTRAGLVIKPKAYRRKSAARFAV